MNTIHEQLKEKIIELEQIHKVREHIFQLKKRLVAEEKDLAVMEIMLDKEQRDVEALEREGLQSMFRKFLGDREEKLEKEREEYVRASLRFNELYKSVELIRFELDLLSRKEQDPEAIQFQVELIIKNREAELLKNNPLISRQLQEIYIETDRLNKLSVELDEAYEAGQLVFGYLRKIEAYLYEAKHSQFRYQAIDHARDMTYKARHAFVAFGNELRHVYHHIQPVIDINIEEFGNLADLFFSEMITSWFVYQRINKSLNKIIDTRQRIELILDKLAEEKMKTNNSIELLEVRKRKLIVNSGPGSAQ